MALLLPCENEISAHVLRSRLLSHGVESVIVHGNAATLWGGWLFRPRLMVADDDWDLVCDFCAQDADPIDESFIEPAETTAINENLGFTSVLPPLPALMISAIIGHFVAGVLALVLATIGASARGESSRGFQGDQSATPFILVALDGGGVIFGLIVWQLLRLARSCRLRADGTLPLHARFVFLGAMPEAWLGLAFYLLVRLLFADLPKALRK